MPLCCCSPQPAVVGLVAVGWECRWLLWACWGGPGAAGGSCGQNASVARPGGVQGTRWDRDNVGKSISVIFALIAAHTIAFCLPVGGAANSSRSLSRQACLPRAHLGRQSWKSWGCDGLKSSRVTRGVTQGKQQGLTLLAITLIPRPRGEASGHAQLHPSLNKWEK